MALIKGRVSGGGRARELCLGGAKLTMLSAMTCKI